MTQKQIIASIRNLNRRFNARKQANEIRALATRVTRLEKKCK